MDPEKSYVERTEVNRASVGTIRDVEVHPAAAALAAATEAKKPSLVSPGMLRLWMVIGIGE